MESKSSVSLSLLSRHHVLTPVTYVQYYFGATDQSIEKEVE